MKKYKEEFKEALKGIFEKLENVDILRGWVNDVYVTWWIILVAWGFSLVTSFMYMFFLRCCTDVITWFLIILFDVMLIALGAGLYFYAGVKE